MLYMRLCYLLLFLLILSQRKQNEKQDKAGFKMQFWGMCYFPKFFFNLYKCQRGICMWFISTSSIVRSATFWGKSTASATFLSLKSCLLGQHRDTLKIKCSMGTAGFSQERAWKWCIKHIRKNKINKIK